MIALLLYFLRSLVVMALVASLGSALTRFGPSTAQADAPLAPSASAPSQPGLAPAEAQLSDEPILGLQFELVTPQLAQTAGLGVDAGALVRTLDTGGFGERAGLQIGDVIERVNDQAVDAGSPLSDLILAIHRQGRFVLTIWRAGRELNIPVDLTGKSNDIQS